MSDLVERTPLLAVLQDLVDRTAVGQGRRLVVEGEAGIGKTVLLAEAAGRAGEAGLRVLRATGHPLEAALAWGGLRQLLEPALEELAGPDRRRLAAGAGRAAVRLLAGEPVEEDELELVHAAYRLVADLATRDAPVLVVVDDLQWLDRPSTMFVLYLSQRVGRVSVLASLRTGEPPAAPDLVERLLGEVAGEALRVPALSARGCAEVVRDRFPAASAAFCEESCRVTAGNPLLLAELLDATRAAAPPGHEADDVAAARLAATSSVSLRRSTAARLAPAGAEGRRLVEAIALLAPGDPLHRAARLAGLTPAAAARAADRLRAAGVLHAVDPPELAHPLVRSAVLAGVPDADRGLRHLRAAALAREDGAGPEQVATHLLEGTATGAVETVELLRAAAAHARERAAPDSAARYLERALAEPPPAAERGRLLAELAEAELLAGRPRAMERLDESLRDVDAVRDPALFVRLGDVLFQSGRYLEAAAVFDRALRAGSEVDPGLRNRLRACRLAMETLRPGGLVAADLDVDAPGGDRFLDVHLAIVSVMGVKDVEDTRRLARAALGDGALLAEQGVRLDLMIALGCLVWADLFEECEAVITDALRVASRAAAHLGRAHLLFGRSWLLFWSGRLAEAERDAAEAIEPWRGGWNGQVDFARFWQAVALIELGRLVDADAVLAEREPVSEDARAAAGAEAVGVATIALARARLAAARGDVEAAVVHARAAGETAGRLPFLANPTVLPWRSDLALALRASGDLAGARHWAEEELVLARRYAAPRALGVALRAAGLVEGGEPGLGMLVDAVDVLARSPARLELTRARIDLGSALRRSGRRGEAARQLRLALEAAADMGAVRLEARARAELAAAGARPRRTAQSGAAALTASERRVCELAARGRSNPEIAAELYLSRRTVEFHLAGAFRKLGVQRRSQLADALRDPG